MISRLYDSSRATSVAVIVDSPWKAITYGELTERLIPWRSVLAGLPHPVLGWIQCRNSLGSLYAYLAALAEQIPVGLADAANEQSNEFLRTYNPSFLIQPAGREIPARYELHWTSPEGDVVLRPVGGAPYEAIPHPDLALMLTTSGSTGNAKVVRLSRANLLANASSISEYLKLGPGEIAIQSLPMHYSYGLSLINSHFFAGGTVALTGSSFMRPEFWGFFERAACTSFAGVPYSYETLQRLRWKPEKFSSLRVMTQAGGHLKPEIVRSFHEATSASGRQFFVMYGQTEATARISFVPPNRLAQKLGMIGIPIPNGQLELQPVQGSPHQELVYRGANVMLGYASAPTDLSFGDVLGGTLRTGDLAEVDAEGFFKITGRLARFAKLFGRRIQLGDVEMRVEQKIGLPAAAIEGPDCVIVFVEGAKPQQLDRVGAELADFLAVPPIAVKPHAIDRIPYLPSGKKNYPLLASLC
jgi:long-chain acyl-CoA synthetase